MSAEKEPHHFSRKEFFAEGAVMHNGLFQADATVAYYGESSTTYFVSEYAIERIKKNLHDPKIVIVLRDPVERLISHYKWLRKLGLERETFTTAMKKYGYGFDAEKNYSGNYKSYLQFSNYSKYVPIWQDAFGTNKVLLLRSEALWDNQEATLARCLAFLGLPEYRIAETVAVNTTEEIISVDFPANIRSFAKLVPAWMKHSRYYRDFKGLLRRRLDPCQEIRISSVEKAWLIELLGDDIAFYENAFRGDMSSSNDLYTR